MIWDTVCFLLYSRWLSMLAPLLSLGPLSYLPLEVEGGLVSGDLTTDWLREARWWEPCRFPGCHPDFRVIIQAWAQKFTFLSASGEGLTALPHCVRGNPRLRVAGEDRGWLGRTTGCSPCSWL